MDEKDRNPELGNESRDVKFGEWLTLEMESWNESKATINNDEEKMDDINCYEEEMDDTNDDEEEMDDTNDDEEEMDDINDCEEEMDAINGGEEEMGDINYEEEKMDVINDGEEERDDIRYYKICIDSDEEERKLKCGGYATRKQQQLPSTATRHLFARELDSLKNKDNISPKQ